jgi:hypothetical protein
MPKISRASDYTNAIALANSHPNAVFYVKNGEIRKQSAFISFFQRVVGKLDSTKERNDVEVARQIQAYYAQLPKGFSLRVQNPFQVQSFARFFSALSFHERDAARANPTVHEGSIHALGTQSQTRSE